MKNHPSKLYEFPWTAKENMMSHNQGLLGRAYNLALKDKPTNPRKASVFSVTYNRLPMPYCGSMAYEPAGF